MIYAFSENYVLPLSNDDVVGARARCWDGCREDTRSSRPGLLLGYMYAQPGKKLLFMGGEFGQADEWNHDKSLAWNELRDPMHQG